MKCMNCEVEAGRRGNRHVKAHEFTCKRIKRQLQTKRKWYGRCEKFWADVEVDSLIPTPDLLEWRPADEYSNNYGHYLARDLYNRYDGGGSRNDDHDYRSSYTSEKTYVADPPRSYEPDNSSGWSSSSSSNADTSSWGTGGSSSNTSDSSPPSSSSSSSSD